MKRRNFLKLLGVSPIVPSVLMAKEKEYIGFRHTKAFYKAWENAPFKRAPEKAKRWFTLKLAPEYENIEGAKEWIQRVEDEVYVRMADNPDYWVLDKLKE